MYIFSFNAQNKHKPRGDMKNMLMDRIALIISIIGCLNWGLIGIFKFDLISWIFGSQGALASRVIYTVVALAGLWCVSLLFRPREQEVPVTRENRSNVD